MSELELIRADILYTGMGLPIRSGAVVVGGQTIAAAGDFDTLRVQYPQAEPGRRVDVIAPLPVNAHAHLDMSDYAFQALPYFQWIPEVVIAGRHSRGLAGAKKGLAQVRASGAAALGDVVWPGTPEVMEWLLSEADMGGVAYWEVLDPNPATAEQTFAQVVQDVARFRTLERPGGMRLGLSPHATHTVSSKLHRLLADFAQREGLPLQIHVAEHPSELELFASGTGPLAESFARMVQFTSPGLTLPEVLGRAPDTGTDARIVSGRAGRAGRPTHPDSSGQRDGRGHPHGGPVGRERRDLSAQQRQLAVRHLSLGRLRGGGRGRGPGHRQCGERRDAQYV